MNKCHHENVTIHVTKCVRQYRHIYDILTTLPQCWCYKGTIVNIALSVNTSICLDRLLIVHLSCNMSPTLNVKPIIICHSLLTCFQSLWFHNVPLVITNQEIVSSTIQSSVHYIITQFVGMYNIPNFVSTTDMEFMQILVIHDIIHSLFIRAINGEDQLLVTYERVKFEK